MFKERCPCRPHDRRAVWKQRRAPPGDHEHVRALGVPRCGYPTLRLGESYSDASCPRRWRNVDRALFISPPLRGVAGLALNQPGQRWASGGITTAAFDGATFPTRDSVLPWEWSGSAINSDRGSRIPWTLRRKTRYVSAGLKAGFGGSPRKDSSRRKDQSARRESRAPNHVRKPSQPTSITPIPGHGSPLPQQVDV